MADLPSASAQDPPTGIGGEIWDWLARNIGAPIGKGARGLQELLLTDQPPLVRLLEGAALGLGGASPTSLQTLSQAWQARDERKRNAAQVAKVAQFLKDKGVDVPPEVLSTVGLEPFIPKPIPAIGPDGKPVYEMVSPMGGPPTPMTDASGQPIGPIPKASGQGAIMHAPGMPVMQRDTQGNLVPVLGPDGKPIVQPFRPQRPNTPPRLVHATEIGPDGKPHVVYRNPVTGTPVMVGGEAPATGGTGNAQDVQDTADAIAEGTQPPVLTGLYRNTLAVRGALKRKGYDLATANRDWQAINKHLATLQGPAQETLRQSVEFAYQSLDVIDDLYSQWQKLGGPGGYRALNKANLFLAKQSPGEAGRVAQQLDAQIADLVTALATVYKGGNASTNQTLLLAAKNLSGDWNEEQFRGALDQARKNLQIRRNSINTSAPVGVTPGSPYLPQSQGGPQAAAPSALPSPGPGWTVTTVEP